MADRTESLGSDSFVQTGFVWLLQDGTVFVRMRRINSDGLSRRLEQTNKKTLWVGAEHGAGRILQITVEKDYLLLWLSDYEMCTQLLEWKLREQDIILKAVTA